LTPSPVSGYRMGMAGRPGIGSRLVLLVAVASTLLATWLPAVRACPCVAASPASVADRAETAPEPPRTCPCCGHQPGGDDVPPCCRDHRAAPEPGTCAPCDCKSAPPQTPEPTAPPRPSDTDEIGGPTATDAVTALEHARPPVTTPAVEAARGRAGPPPVDLIISLSRLTC
jgi:hypothetical protein